jgi:hypothetical protein
MSGYAYDTKQHWQESSDENWDTIMYTPTGDEKYVGVREIDGSRFNVWRSTDRYVAQLQHMTQNHKGLLRRNADALPKPRRQVDPSLSRVSRIEREHTRREKPFDPAAHYPRGTKPHHFAINPTDPRDVPHHLREVRVNYYRDDPERNGESVKYDTFENGTAAEGEPQWYEVEHAGGSDYSGGSATRANHKVLTDMLREHHPDDQKPVAWVDSYGGHGTYSIFVVWDELDDEIKQTLSALEDYPVIDDQAMSEVENEIEEEAWSNYYKREFERAVIGGVNAEYPEDPEIDDWPEDTDSYTLLRMAMGASNTYWAHESEGPYLDLKRITPVAVDFIIGAREEPGHSVEDHEELEKIRSGFKLQLDLPFPKG